MSSYSFVLFCFCLNFNNISEHILLIGHHKYYPMDNNDDHLHNIEPRVERWSRIHFLANLYYCLHWTIHNMHILHLKIQKFDNKFDQNNKQRLTFHIDDNHLLNKHFVVFSYLEVDKIIVEYYKHNYMDNRQIHFYHNKHPEYDRFLKIFRVINR